MLRIPVDDRFKTVGIGCELRFAAIPADDPLACRGTLSPSHLGGPVIVTDTESSTTTPALWPEANVTLTRISDMEEGFDGIATGQAVGTTTDATVARHPRRGVADPTVPSLTAAARGGRVPCRRSEFDTRR
jgi:hypothetical protein